MTADDLIRRARAAGVVVTEGPRAKLPVGIPPAGPADLPGLVAAVVAAGFPEPVPEYRFHPVRKWRFDLAWPALMVAFEREGLGGGRHQRHHGYTGDCEKYSEAAALGWRLIRATAAQIKDGKAFRWLAATLEART